MYLFKIKNVEIFIYQFYMTLLIFINSNYFEFLQLNKLFELFQLTEPNAIYITHFHRQTAICSLSMKYQKLRSLIYYIIIKIHSNIQLGTKNQFSDLKSVKKKKDLKPPKLNNIFF